jgi:hypothetical protein
VIPLESLPAPMASLSAASSYNTSMTAPERGVRLALLPPVEKTRTAEGHATLDLAGLLMVNSTVFSAVGRDAVVGDERWVAAGGRGEMGGWGSG